MEDEHLQHLMLVVLEERKPFKPRQCKHGEKILPQFLSQIKKNKTRLRGICCMLTVIRIMTMLMVYLNKIVEVVKILKCLT